MSNYYNRQWRLPNAWNGTESNVNKQSNYSMDFDGSSYIDVGNNSSLTPTNAISISLWLKTSDTAIYRGLVDKWSSNTGYMLHLGPTGSNQGKPVFAIGSQSDIVSSTAVNDGNWHHITVTCDNTTCYIYVDGVQTGTGSLTMSGISNSDNLKIAGDNTSTFYINGQIDGVAIFDYALSSSQVTTLYGSSSTGIGNPMSLNPKPVAYYPLGDQDVFNGSNYLVPNSSLKDYVFSFDGINDYITIPDSSDLEPQNLTVSFWINAGVQGTFDYYLEKGNWSYAVYTGTTTTDLLFFIYDGSNYYLSNALTNVLDSNWHHIVFTYDGSQIIGYKDGVANTPVSASATILYDANPLRLFSRAPAQGSYPSGKMSNVQIFNTALPATGSNSIETLYNNGSPLTSMSGYSSLVGWYKLDASELYSDSWSVENNASPTTFKSALDFDGSNDYVDCGNNSSLNPTSQLTLSVWAKRIGSGTGANPCIFSSSKSSSNNGGFLLETGINRFRFYVDTTGSGGWVNIINNADLVNNQWYHVVCIWDGSDIKMYVDGVLQSQTASVTQITYSTNTNARIGRYATSYFNGSISNVAIYNTALSASNITTLYNNGVPQATIYGSPVAHYKLDNTTTGIQDSAGSNNGTNNGATEVATYVNTTAGISSGMNQSALVQSDLSFTNGYSPYALDFDGTNDYIDCGNNSSLQFQPTDALTLSCWFKADSYSSNTIIASNNEWTGAYRGYNLQLTSTGVLRFTMTSTYTPSNNYIQISSSTTISTGSWYHIVITKDTSIANTGLNMYINGSPTSVTRASLGTLSSFTYVSDFNIGGVGNGNQLFNGSISNVSVWNTNLTSSQVSEIYNEGVPSNLNNHSAYSNLVSWWQLGSNSSFNTNWTVLDEKGSNNGTSSNMTENDIVDGVGSYANGISSGMSDAILGDAPYSTANALSINMDVLDRTDDTPS